MKSWRNNGLARRQYVLTPLSFCFLIDVVRNMHRWMISIKSLSFRIMNFSASATWLPGPLICHVIIAVTYKQRVNDVLRRKIKQILTRCRSFSKSFTASLMEHVDEDYGLTRPKVGCFWNLQSHLVGVILSPLHPYRRCDLSNYITKSYTRVTNTKLFPVLLQHPHKPIQSLLR